MKQIALIILIFFFSINSYGQASQDSTLLEKIIKEMAGGENAAMVKNVPAGCWDKLGVIVKNGTWRAFRKYDKGHDIILTEKEKGNLLDQIKQNKPFKWSNKVLPRFIKIEADSMESYFISENKRHDDLMKDALLNKDTATFYKNKYVHPWVFTITKPVYFRDNSFCLINIIALCGTSCGRSEIAVYKMEEGNWMRWLVLEAGDY
ncbi:MAG: hypothetical protein ABI772_08775 [Bacteroidota bacterium]